MKKLIALGVSIFAAFSLSACDDSSSASGDDPVVDSSAAQTVASSSSLSEAPADDNPLLKESSSSVVSDLPSESSSSAPAANPEEEGCVESVNAQVTLTNVESVNISCSAATKDWTVYNADLQILYTCDGSQWSEKVVVVCKHEEEPLEEVPVTYGTLTDSRDGKTYKTVVIGEKEWMAENLNFYKSTDGSVVMDSSFCYDDLPSNCEKYGRLYQEFDAAEACPEGWSMPTEIDWFDFTRVLKNEFPDKNLNEVTRATSGWDDEWKSNNASGFSAVAAGMRNSEGDYVDEEYRAYFWGDKGMVYYAWTLGWLSEFTAGSRIYAYYAYSLRCVKN